MKFTGIAAMLAVVTAVTGAAIPNINGAIAEVDQVTGDVKGLLSNDLGSQQEAKVDKLVSQLEKVQSQLKQLTGGEEKRQLGLNVDADVNVAKRQGDLVGGTLNTVEETVGGVLGGVKRDDAVSGLANQLLPQLTQGGILPQNLSVQQLTGLLKVLNVNGLLTNVESVLSGLLGGGLLKGLTGGLLGGLLKREDAVSTLAGKLLPELTQNGILPQAVSLQQLTGLLNVLQVNGLLTNVESTVNNLLNGLGLQGLTGGLLGALNL